MGRPQPQIDRWCFASVSKHFVDKAAEYNALYPDLAIKIEGEDDPPEKRSQRQIIEIRMDGPEQKELSRDYWHLRVEINILISTKSNDEDFHDHRELCGFVASWFDRCIEVRKYGNRLSDDPNVVVGTLVLDHGFREKTALAHFGQVDPATRLVQSTCEGHYDMKEVF